MFQKGLNRRGKSSFSFRSQVGHGKIGWMAIEKAGFGVRSGRTQEHRNENAAGQVGDDSPTSRVPKINIMAAATAGLECWIWLDFVAESVVRKLDPRALY